MWFGNLSLLLNPSLQALVESDIESQRNEILAIPESDGEDLNFVREVQRENEPKKRETKREREKTENQREAVSKKNAKKRNQK